MNKNYKDQHTPYAPHCLLLSAKDMGVDFRKISRECSVKINHMAHTTICVVDEILEKLTKN